MIIIIMTENKIERSKEIRKQKKVLSKKTKGIERFSTSPLRKSEKNKKKK